MRTQKGRTSAQPCKRRTPWPQPRCIRRGPDRKSTHLLRGGEHRVSPALPMSAAVWAANTRLRGEGEHITSAVWTGERPMTPQIRASEEANRHWPLGTGEAGQWAANTRLREGGEHRSGGCEGLPPLVAANTRLREGGEHPAPSLPGPSPLSRRKYAPPWRRRTPAFDGSGTVAVQLAANTRLRGGGEHRPPPSAARRRGRRCRKYAPPWRRRTPRSPRAASSRPVCRKYAPPWRRRTPVTGHSCVR